MSKCHECEIDGSALQAEIKELKDDERDLMDAIDSKNRKLHILEIKLGEKHASGCGCPTCHVGLLEDIDHFDYL